MKKKNLMLILATSMLVVFSLTLIASAEEQDVEVTIDPVTNVMISPTVLNFGQVASGTINNTALNGPIMFNTTGSNTDIKISVTNVTGFPFDTGLRLNSISPVGQSWTLECTVVNDVCEYSSPELTATLDVQEGAAAGTKTGTIVYTITGTPPE